MKQERRKGSLKILAGALALLLTLTLLPVSVFADDVYTDDYGNTVEWWNFRNTATNNAVTDRPTPTTDQEAWGKWAGKYGKDWSESPTPPVIVNDKLYIGMGKRLVEVDKETGEALRYSEEMPGSVGYAMQSPVYADGKIFIAITLGRICAINLSDLKVAWTTDNSEILRGQTVSPISYVKIGETGYVYTGTAMLAGGEGDLICATTDDKNVTTDADGKKIKALTWHFNPAQVDKENLAASNSVALGYYWTGAYVNEKFLAIGSDNGSTMGDGVHDTAFYTLNPLSGEIIDAVYGIKGQVRSTTVYDNGNLYFSTKGAKVYKIPVDEEGNLGEASYIDLGEFGALTATATPVVYGGKIYLGVAGRGNQFRPDGGHGFMTIRDDAALSSASYLYNIPVPGYPQAGALLSDYHVSEDFDGDGTADGRVYLFFTYNAQPGGLFYTYDTPSQTKPTELTAEEAKIFVPNLAQQQYCISSIVVDTDSTLYYKNDSGYVFAVESNPAALLGMSIKNEDGSEVKLDQAFQPKIAEYNAVAKTDATKVMVELTLEEGVTATINGAAYTGQATEIALAPQDTTFEVVTAKNGKSRKYQVTLHKASINCELSALSSAINNAVPGVNNKNTRYIDPELNREFTDYTFDWITTGTGSTRTPADPATTKMMNIFLKTESDKATVQVFPGRNVEQPSNGLNEDGSIKRYEVAGDVYQWRYPVYSADVTRDSTATIVVTAEDGKTQKEYNITFSRRIYVSEVLMDEELRLDPGESYQLEPKVDPAIATDKTLTFRSSDETVATVDENGLVTAVGEGIAEIRADSADRAFAVCKVYVRPLLLINDQVQFFPKEGEAEIDFYMHDSEEVKFRAEVPEGYEVQIDDADLSEFSWKKDGGAETVTVAVKAPGEENARTLKVRMVDGHRIEFVEAKEATCEEAGCNAHWRCTVCGAFFEDEEGTKALSPEAVLLPAKGHAFGEPVYTWAEDYKTATAERICQNDPSHVETETVQTRARVVKEPTYEEYGKTNYRAVFTNLAFAEQEVTAEDIPPIYRSASSVFIDVNPGDWFEADVDYVYNWRNAKHTRLMSGYSGKPVFGSFDPLARAQFAVMLHRLADEPEAAFNPNAFKDITEQGNFYDTACMWAKESGVITGYENGYFGINDPINREQMATILYRYAKNYMKLDVSEAFGNGNLNQFADEASVSPFAAEALQWANGAGIIRGNDLANGTRTIDPQGNAARAQIAAMFQRFIVYIEGLQ